MRLHFTSSYHPEVNGQAEQTNQMLEQYLCIYYNYQQNNWSELLPLAEFSYNNTLSATTSVSLFFTNKGYHFNLSVYPEWDIAFFRVCDFIINLDKLQGMLKEEIAKAQQQYQPLANSCWRQPPDFQVGQSVFVRAQYFYTTHLSKKLSKKYLRPYEIIAQPSLQSFTLCLPNTIRAIHLVFHISMLEPCKGDWAPDSRRILSYITVYGYNITHLQENPQRLEWGSWRDVLHYILGLHSGSLWLELY